MRISTDFDNGALAFVRESSPGTFDLWSYRPEEYRTYLELAPRRPYDRAEGESGERDGAKFAFHFRLDGCRGRTVVLRFHLREIKRPDCGRGARLTRDPPA